jgi:hypothetical protein
MRSIQLTELFATIIAGIAPAGALAGCGIGSSDCDPNKVESQTVQTLILAPDAGVVAVFDDSPDGGEWNSVTDGSDCSPACQKYASGLAGCGRAEGTACRVVASDGVNTKVECSMNNFSLCLPPGGAVCGRRPLRARRKRVTAGAKISLSGLFAEMAALERDSVAAFRELAAALQAHRAPSALIERSRKAARDEAHHTRMMARLAGLAKVPGGSRRTSGRMPEWEEVVIDNAVEGCVRETFGALVAYWQGRNAARTDVRETMRAVGADETEHAALAWDIHAWASTQLAREAMARVQVSAQRAVRELHRELDIELPLSVRKAAGLPSRGQSKGLLAGLENALWRRLAAPVPALATATVTPPG